MSLGTKSSRECSCRGVRQPQQHSSASSTVLCPSCVDQALLSRVQLRHQALLEKNEAHEFCSERLRQVKPEENISELSAEAHRLREKVTKLRQECGTLAVRIASQVVDNDERRAQQDKPSLPRHHLQRLQQSLCDPATGALAATILQTTEQVRISRFRWACHAFSIHRLDVGTENNDATESSRNRRERRPRGIGKIGGLPLPHAGQELYVVLPPEELLSALRLVASLTCVVARCLGIILPHPILLQPSGNPNNGSDIVDTVKPPENPLAKSEKKERAPIGSSSTSSLKSLMSTTTTWGRSAKQALARATGGVSEEEHIAPTSMEPSLVQQRLNHATRVVLAEDNSSSRTTLYFLSHDTLSDDHFAIGLQLLQNDVVALCIRAGVPVSALWPAEAVLLNLYALWLYCQEQVLPEHPSE